MQVITKFFDAGAPITVSGATYVKIGIERPQSISIHHKNNEANIDIISHKFDRKSSIWQVTGLKGRPTFWVIIPKQSILSTEDLNNYKVLTALTTATTTNYYLYSILLDRSFVQYAQNIMSFYGEDEFDKSNKWMNIFCYGSYEYFQPIEYDFIYWYDDNYFPHYDIQVSVIDLPEQEMAEVSSITFTNIPKKPLYWCLYTDTAFIDPNVSCIIAAIKDNTTIRGLVTQSDGQNQGVQYMNFDWEEEYENNTLTISVKNGPETFNGFCILWYVVDNTQQPSMYSFQINGTTYYINENDILEFDNLSEEQITITPASNSADEYTIVTIGYETEE